jgi:beta-glucanase (GH16 family)
MNPYFLAKTESWRVFRLVVFALSFSGATILLHGQGGVMPKTLIAPGSPDAATQIVTKEDGQVTATTGPDGVTVAIKPGLNEYPGITLKPASGSSWDLGLYGHVEAKITNTGDKTLNLNLRVDNAGDYRIEPWNGEAKEIEPGQTRILRVYFGYSYGFRPGFKLNPEAVTEILFFTKKTSEDFSFRIETVRAAGWAGEKIGVDPDRIARKPPGGVLLGGAPLIPAEVQIHADDGASGSLGPEGKSLRIDFAGSGKESVTFRPSTGLWNLNEQLQVRVKLKNIGQVPAIPSVRLESDAGPSDVVAAEAPLAPGAETEIVVPFAARVPWKGQVDPRQEDASAKGTWDNQSGTGTRYHSNSTTGVTILSDSTPGAKSLEVTSILADLPPLVLPSWLGQRPPVDGGWTQTLDEEFNGDSIDLHRWNVHCANWWDKRMHFSKDEVIVKDGFLALRLEKKTGYNNDDPTGKTSYSDAKSDYAAGQPDTYGKWTQRYGYFEIREKQPTAKCLWPGFWMMPDRGLKNGRGARDDVANGGMEVDVTESQSSWGIHRFNIACHWDGYGATHKSIGTSANYVQADKDGFIVVGLLWTPGSYVVYGNGKEIFRWESPRVSDQQAYLILQNEIGGWDNEEVDDAQLPADFIVDYIRVWQRKDLATPEDGPKPNQGNLDAFHETLPAP